MISSLKEWFANPPHRGHEKPEASAPTASDGFAHRPPLQTSLQSPPDSHEWQPPCQGIGLPVRPGARPATHLTAVMAVPSLASPLKLIEPVYQGRLVLPNRALGVRRLTPTFCCCRQREFSLRFADDRGLGFMNLFPLPIPDRAVYTAQRPTATNISLLWYALLHAPAAGPARDHPRAFASPARSSTRVVARDDYADERNHMDNVVS